MSLEKITEKKLALTLKESFPDLKREILQTITHQYFQATAKYLKKEKVQTIPHIGTFKLRWHEMRKVYNPQLKEEIKISAHYATRFHASQDFQKEIDEALSGQIAKDKIEEGGINKMAEQNLDKSDENVEAMEKDIDLRYEKLNPSAASDGEGEPQTEEAEEAKKVEAAFEQFEQIETNDVDSLKTEDDLPSDEQSEEGTGDEPSPQAEREDEKKEAGLESQTASPESEQRSEEVAVGAEEKSPRRFEYFLRQRKTRLMLTGTLLGIVLVLLMLIFKKETAKREKNADITTQAEVVVSEEERMPYDDKPSMSEEHFELQKVADQKDLKIKYLWSSERNGKFMVIEWGDSLEKIAQQEYGDRKYWPHIYFDNQETIASPNQLIPVQDRVIVSGNKMGDLGELYYRLFEETKENRAFSLKMLKHAYDENPTWLRTKLDQLSSAEREFIGFE